MISGIVTPTTNMCMAASAVTVSGQRRRPTRTPAPSATAVHCTQTGCSTSRSRPKLRTSSRAISENARVAEPTATSHRVTDPGRSQGSPTAKNSPMRPPTLRRASGRGEVADIAPA
jgi:hypothetical protein